jgi:hypothetical protein
VHTSVRHRSKDGLSSRSLSIHEWVLVNRLSQNMKVVVSLLVYGRTE